MANSKAVELSVEFLKNYSKDRLVMDDFLEDKICGDYTENEVRKHKVSLQERYEIGIELKNIIPQEIENISERIAFCLKNIDGLDLELSQLLLSPTPKNFFIKMEDMDMQLFELSHNVVVELKGIGRFVELLQNLNIVPPLGVNHEDVPKKSI